MLIVFAAPRRPTAIYNTILESGTHGDGSRLGHFRFHCFYKKCGGKEEFKFSGLSGQISNFLTLFKMCAKICQVATKQEKIITMKNV